MSPLPVMTPSPEKLLLSMPKSRHLVATAAAQQQQHRWAVGTVSKGRKAQSLSNKKILYHHNIVLALWEDSRHPQTRSPHIIQAVPPPSEQGCLWSETVLASPRCAVLGTPKAQN